MTRVEEPGARPGKGSERRRSLHRMPQSILCRKNSLMRAFIVPIYAGVIQHAMNTLKHLFR